MKIPEQPKQNTPFAPCLMPVLGLIVGIALAHVAPSLLIWALVLATASAIGFYLCRGHSARSTLMLAILSVVAGAIHFYQTNSELPANHIRNYLEICPLESLPHIELTGTIVTPATINQPQRTFPYQSSPNLRTRFLLRADHLQALGKTARVTGLVEVSLPDMHDSYRPGTKVRLVGRLSSIKNTQPKLPCLKAFTYYQQNLIFARISLSDSDSIVPESDNPCSTPAIFNRIQEWARSLLMGSEPPTGPYTDDLLNAVILGKQNFVENEFNQAMMRIGATHLLAVSGFNLAVLAMGLWFIGHLLGLRRNAILLLIIGSTLFYGVVTDFRPSVTRAVIMILIVCIGQLRNRRSNALNALALSAGIILIFNPSQLFQPGFQLSFAATLGLIKLSALIHRALVPFSVSNYFSPDLQLSSMGLFIKSIEDQIRQLLSASLAASLGAFPLVMYHFNLLSLIGPISSVVLYPAATLLTLAGFAQLVIAIVVPILNPVIEALTNFTASLLANLAIWLGKIPGSALTVASPQWFVVIGFMVILFAPKLKYRFLWSLVIVAVYLSSWLGGSRSSSPWLYVTGPGQGQSVIINTGKGLAMIDAGASQTGQAAKLVAQIACHYLTQPVLVLLTSPDQRYFNDLWSLTKDFPQTAVLVPESFKHFSPSYEPIARLIDDANFHRQAVMEGATVRIEKLGLQLLYMPEFELTTLEPTRRTPGSVILMEYQETKVLVTSVLTPMMCRLLELNYPKLRADTLIVLGSATNGKAIEDLINFAGIKTLAIGSWIDPHLQRQWRKIEQHTGCEVIEISQEGGFLVDRLGK